MKRLRRIIFNVLTALSLLLCVATAGLWVRSYTTQDTVYRDNNTYGIRRILSATEGHLMIARINIVERFRLGRTVRREAKWSYESVPPGGEFVFDTPITDARFAGFSYRRGELEQYWDCCVVVVPFWAITLALAMLPAIRLRKLRRRWSPGCCPTCSYDLRATPDRSPECGTINAQAKALSD